ncbi:hypothetical protein C8R43DRAFT_1130787 [Mycena crocata]|nr:hypothetical protein C8R43DRAFT_1130787 [Mycena crocata]
MASPAYPVEHDYYAPPLNVATHAIVAWEPQGYQLKEKYERQLLLLRKEMYNLSQRILIAERCAHFAEQVVNGTVMPNRSIFHVSLEIWLEIFQHVRGSSSYLRLLQYRLVCHEWDRLIMRTTMARPLDPVRFQGTANELLWPSTVFKALAHLTPPPSIILSVSSSSFPLPILDMVFGAKALTRLTIEGLGCPSVLGRQVLIHLRQNPKRPIVTHLSLRNMSNFIHDSGSNVWLDWTKAERQPEQLMLDRFVAPENNLRIGWEALRSYTESNTVRDGPMPFSHLEKLGRNLTILRIAGLILPVREDGENIEMQSLLELHIEVSCPLHSSTPNGMFGAMKCPVLKVLQVTGDADTRMHAKLSSFILKCPRMEFFQLTSHLPPSICDLKRHLQASCNLRHLKVYHQPVNDDQEASSGILSILSPELFSVLLEDHIIPSLTHLSLAEATGKLEEWRATDGPGLAAITSLLHHRTITVDLRTPNSSSFSENTWEDTWGDVWIWRRKVFTSGIRRSLLELGVVVDEVSSAPSIEDLTEYIQYT